MSLLLRVLPPRLAIRLFAALLAAPTYLGRLTRRA